MMISSLSSLADHLLQIAPVEKQQVLADLSPHLDAAASSTDH
jgi:hypothetical protein